MAKYASIRIILRHRGAVQARASPDERQGGAPPRLFKEAIHLMKQPDELVEHMYLEHVRKPKHALYGRKKSLRMLNQTIDDYMRKISGPSSAI